MAAAPAVVEEADPRGLPEHDLLRQRGLRRAAGGAHLLRARRAGPAPARSGAARGDPGEPDRLRPRHASGGRGQATAGRAPGDARGREDHAGGARAGRRETAAAGRGHPAAGHRADGAVLRQLREAPADRPVRRLDGVRRWVEGEDDDRPRAAGAGTRGDLEMADGAGRAVGCARRDRSPYGCGEGDGRRRQLSPEPVQPGRAERAAARLRLQAVRARDRAPAGNLPGDADDVRAAGDRPRGQVLGRLELRRHLLRLDRPRAGHDRVGQRRLRAAHAARRRPRRSRRRRRAWESAAR